MPRQKFLKLRRYLQLHDDRPFTDGQFERPDPAVPWRALALAIFLFVTGATGIIMGTLLYLGYFPDDKWADRGIPFLALGCLLFVPGAYHVYVAYYAWHRTPGYDFSMIPDYD